MNDPRRQLVYSHNRSAVMMTMVAGRVVMRDGRVLGIDERELRAEIRGAKLRSMPPSPLRRGRLLGSSRTGGRCINGRRQRTWGSHAGWATGDETAAGQPQHDAGGDRPENRRLFPRMTVGITSAWAGSFPRQ